MLNKVFELNKVLEDHCCAEDIALAWWLNQKSSLQNVHIFSCFKLENAQNASLLCAFIDKRPVMSITNHSEILKQHLNSNHKA